jgi:hypothetical protein
VGGDIGGDVVELRGDLFGALAGAVGDDDLARPGGDEMLRGEGAHLAGAENEDGSTGEGAEDLTRELYGRRAYREGAAADFGFFAHPFAAGDGSPKQFIKDAGDGAVFARGFEGGLDLTQNLAFAEDERIDAAGNAKQVAGAGAARAVIQVRMQAARGNVVKFREELLDARRGFGRRQGVYLSAVARG